MRNNAVAFLWFGSLLILIGAALGAWSAAPALRASHPVAFAGQTYPVKEDGAAISAGTAVKPSDKPLSRVDCPKVYVDKMCVELPRLESTVELWLKKTENSAAEKFRTLAQVPANTRLYAASGVLLFAAGLQLVYEGWRRRSNKSPLSHPSLSRFQLLLWIAAAAAVYAALSVPRLDWRIGVLPQHFWLLASACVTRMLSKLVDWRKLGKLGAPIDRALDELKAYALSHPPKSGEDQLPSEVKAQLDAVKKAAADLPAGTITLVQFQQQLDKAVAALNASMPKPPDGTSAALQETLAPMPVHSLSLSPAQLQNYASTAQTAIDERTNQLLQAIAKEPPGWVKLLNDVEALAQAAKNEKTDPNAFFTALIKALSDFRTQGPGIIKQAESLFSRLAAWWKKGGVIGSLRGQNRKLSLSRIQYALSVCATVVYFVIQTVREGHLPALPLPAITTVSASQLVYLVAKWLGHSASLPQEQQHGKLSI
ncbi:hypothetical protein ACFPVX_22825 [Cohnella faecalis]|uniref:Uncharacterized protein n=1 Tax=Cohnella faecalis TaxID=2315694 RepID=A0A398CJB8_9BACL|nr:hypothetical protein [Cohnella faecalis]RIE02445.1 hypothetical protein D3H35_17220 [Cohnella faecalis]